jgi:two-component system response regulator MprA
MWGAETVGPSLSSSLSQSQNEQRDALKDARILVVEDEPSISGFIRRGLVFEGAAVEVVEDGRLALRALLESWPDLLVLDIMLPEVDGFEVLRRVRAAEAAERRSPIPILLLTARDAVPDRVAGLEAGADDYLVKPFAFDELVARIRALLRRTRADVSPTPSLRFDDLVLDPLAHAVTRAGRLLDLTPREFDLLELFMRHPDQVLPRALIMDRVWGSDFYGDSNVLEVFVGNLRKTLEACGERRILHTVRGVGYVLRLPPE